MTTATEIVVNRGLFLYHLRQNPDNRVFIHGDLTDDCGGRCSVGLGCEVFGIPIVVVDDSAECWIIIAEAYEKLAEKIGDRGPASYCSLVTDIWSNNDNGRASSFAEMADLLEQEIFPCYPPDETEKADEDDIQV